MASLRHEQVYVSSFIADGEVVEAPEDQDVFDLRGTGFGKWHTDGDAIIIGTCYLFVMVHWIAADLGVYTVELDVRDAEGSVVIPAFWRELKEVAHPCSISHWHVSLNGLKAPVGFYYLWVSVDGVAKCPAALWVYGPEE